MPQLVMATRACMPAIVLPTSACSNVGAVAARGTPHYLAMSKMHTLSVQPAEGELSLADRWR